MAPGAWMRCRHPFLPCWLNWESIRSRSAPIGCIAGASPPGHPPSRWPPKAHRPRMSSGPHWTARCSTPPGARGAPSGFASGFDGRERRRPGLDGAAFRRRDRALRPPPRHGASARRNPGWRGRSGRRLPHAIADLRSRNFPRAMPTGLAPRRPWHWASSAGVRRWPDALAISRAICAPTHPGCWKTCLLSPSCNRAGPARRRCSGAMATACASATPRSRAIRCRRRASRPGRPRRCRRARQAARTIVDLIVARQHGQRQAHLRSLLGVLQTGRFSAAPVWRDYIDFVLPQLDPKIADWTVALRHGRVQRVDLRPQGAL